MKHKHRYKKLNWLNSLQNAAHLEGEVLEVALHALVGPVASNETLHVEHGVLRVGGQLVLGGVTDQTLVLGEGHVRRRDAVSLVVGDDFHAAILEDSNTEMNGCFIRIMHICESSLNGSYIT